MSTFDRYTKRWTLHALKALAARPREPLAGPPRSALILRQDRIGDMIMTTGVLRELARGVPGLEVDVLASPSNRPVLRHNPHVRRILIFDRRWGPVSLVLTSRTIRRARYDAVVDTLPLRPSNTATLFALASRAPLRVGVGGRENAFAYTAPVAPPPEPHHIIDRMGALLGAFGLDPAKLDIVPEIFLDAAEREAAERLWSAPPSDHVRLLLNMSARQARRLWPAERFAALAARAAQLSPRIAVGVLAHRDQRVAAQAVCGAAPGTRCFAGLGLREAFGLVASAHVLLTPDTSLVHAASAFGTRTVVLTLRGLEVLFGPYRTDGELVVADGRTLEGATVAQVWEPLRRALEAALSPEGTLRSPGRRLSR